MKHAHRSSNYRLSQFTGSSSLPAESTFFNNMDFLNNTYIPKNMIMYFNDKNLYGIKVQYTNGKDILNGVEGPQFVAREWSFGEKEVVQTVKLISHANSVSGTPGYGVYIDGLKLASNVDIATYIASAPRHDQQKFSTITERPAGVGWDVRGFFGGFNPTSGMQMLGVIWSNEKPGDLSLVPGYSLYQEGAANIRATELREASLKHANKGDQFRLSKFAGDTTVNIFDGNQVFSTLDSIDKTWKVQTITAFFNTAVEDALMGIQLDYTNGKQIKHGKCDGTETEKWVAAYASVKAVSIAMSVRQPGKCMGLTLSIVNNGQLDLVKFLKTSAETKNVLLSAPQGTASESWSFVGFLGSGGLAGVDGLAVVWSKAQ